MVGVACGNIHYRHWRGRKRLMTPTVALAFNLMTAVLGYLPGPRIGFGGHEARRLIRVGAGRLHRRFPPRRVAARSAGDVGVTSLFVTIEGDNFSPEASTLGLAALIQAPPACSACHRRARPTRTPTAPGCARRARWRSSCWAGWWSGAS